MVIYNNEYYNNSDEFLNNKKIVEYRLNTKLNFINNYFIKIFERFEKRVCCEFYIHELDYFYFSLFTIFKIDILHNISYCKKIKYFKGVFMSQPIL